MEAPLLNIVKTNKLKTLAVIYSSR